MIINNQYPGLDEFVVREYGINYDFNYDDIDSFLETLYSRINVIEDNWHTFGSIGDYTLFEEIKSHSRELIHELDFINNIQKVVVIS